MHPSLPQQPEGVQVEEIGVAEAAQLAGTGKALLLDVREDDEWAAGHAPTAFHVPLGNLPHTQLPTGHPVLAICRSGNRSATAAAYLLAHGVDARNVRGGMQAWQTAGLPIATDRPPPGASP